MARGSGHRHPHCIGATAGVPTSLVVSARPARRRRYGRWRTASLAAVYLLMVAHVVHWRLVGRTLAPLELNEVLYTLELGIVTAGFIFMAIAVLATLVFGRFFCGWGCHILALQDLSAAALRRLGIRPKPVRSRALLLVPVGAMALMFVAPHVERLLAGRPAPTLRVLGDEDGWASFVTENFWRNLPGPGVTAITFVVVGFVVVRALGTRSFCHSVCPYGAIFGFVDRLAPGRIVARGDCAACGLCTARCESHVRVHEELLAFGRVVDPACLKDLDCVEACPNGAIAYGFARPAGLRSWSRRARELRARFDWTLGEELAAAATVVLALLALRGVFGVVPFLLALPLAVLTAQVVVALLHLARRPDVRLHGRQLRRSGRLRPAGVAYVACAMAWLGVVAASGIVRAHERAAAQLCKALDAPEGPGSSEEVQSDAALGRTVARLARLSQLLPFHDPALIEPLARLQQEQGRRSLSAGQIDAAIGHLGAALERVPEAVRIRFDLARALAAADHHAEALEHLLVLATALPDDPAVAFRAGESLAAVGRRAEAIAAYRHALALRPDDPRASAALAALQSQIEGSGPPTRP